MPLKTLNSFKAIVSNLPPDLTLTQFEELFTSRKSLRKAFIITDKKTSQSKCFGFVVFNRENDLSYIIKNMNGMDLAGYQLIVKKALKRDEKCENQSDLISIKDRKKYSNIIILGLSSDITFKQLVNTLKPIKNLSNLIFPSPESESTTFAARLTLKIEIDNSDLTAFRKKCEKLIKEDFPSLKNKKIKIIFVDKKFKFSRLIIRNLSFSTKEITLREKFTPFGEIKDLKIVKDSKSNKSKGFAFVEYTRIESAANAINSLNKSIIDNRPIIIDWALSKKHYENLNKQKMNNNIKYKNLREKKIIVNNSKKSEDKVNNSKKSEDKGINYKKKKIIVNNSKKSEDKVNNSKKSENKGKNYKKKKIIENNSKKSEDKGINYKKKKIIVNNSKKSEDKEINNKMNKKINNKNDAKKNQTIFVSNLPISITKKDLYDKFKEHGEIVYIALTKNKILNEPKGSAFIQFNNREIVSKILTLHHSKKIKIGEKEINIMLALTKEDLNEKYNKDKKNMHLIKEGFDEFNIHKNRSMKKRIEKLKNPNMFVSKVRLCIQNISKEIDEKMLKKIIVNKMSNNKNKGPMVKEVRIVRDKKRKDKKGKFRSMSYGFIEFLEHKDALEALKLMDKMNVNGRELQVEFAIENSRKILIRKQRYMSRRLKTNKDKGTKKRIFKGVNNRSSNLKKRRF